MADDVLALRRKSDAERRDGGGRDARAGGAGDGSLRARAVDDMPGVEDGGDPLWFDAREKSLVASDGEPVRIEVGEVELPCTVERVCWPERSPEVHLRAKATMAGPRPLLAGPVTLARGSELVGRERWASWGAVRRWSRARG